MSKRGQYVEELAGIGPRPEAVREYLTANSNLPGPRGNLELAHAFADWAPDALVDELADEQYEYLRFCADLALGERLSRLDDAAVVVRLRADANSGLWRVREAVATGLQRVGDRDLPRLRALVRDWVQDDDPLVQRAAAAAICEPRLLVTEPGARAALDVCEEATRWIASLPAQRRRDDDVRTLRQALGYCWSVAVAADPESGVPRFEHLRTSGDADVQWIVRENLKKNRLQRVLTEPR